MRNEKKASVESAALWERPNKKLKNYFFGGFIFKLISL